MDWTPTQESAEGAGGGVVDERIVGNNQRLLRGRTQEVDAVSGLQSWCENCLESGSRFDLVFENQVPGVLTAMMVIDFNFTGNSRNMHRFFTEWGVIAFRTGIRPQWSASPCGKRWDIAVVESAFSTLKTGCTAFGRSPRGRIMGRAAVMVYIDTWYEH